MIQTIQLSISIVFYLHTVKFQNSSILSNSLYQKYTFLYLTINETLSGAATPDQSGPGNDGNEGVLCIPQSSSITGIPQLDC